MYEVKHTGDAWSTLELVDGSSGAVARLAPGRGGMLTGLRLRGREWLYLDEDTLRDPTKNVRGGNPVLFPSPGRLTGDAWRRGGESGSLRQHGFARNHPWELISESSTGGAAATLRLVASDATRAGYPFEFAAEYTYALLGDAMRITLGIENRGQNPMPVAAGFHPYFFVPAADKARCRIETSATRAFDNVTKREVGIGVVDLTLPEVDLHLLDHGSAESALELGDARITIACSDEFTRWVIWTVEGKDFVCLEPWTAPADALNTGDGLIVVAPGERRELRVEMRA